MPFYLVICGELWRVSTLECVVGELGKGTDLKFGGKLTNVVLFKW